ncbi:MAG: RidA family protein [Chloroflexi bacterium]|nr:MAG: RidA family protein [Chloroflexota bacterium]TMG68250.1 MAG: RidA family protein [Chloroflexota bacterium]
MPTVDPNNPDRFLFSTSSRYEFQFGYSRAIRHGRVVRVAGTAGIGPDGQVVSDDVIDQMRAALQTMRDALADLGCGLGDVIMTRIYVKNTSDIDGVAVIHGETFRDIRPATTIVRVGEFIDPKILVEIEAEAVYGGADDKK